MPKSAFKKIGNHIDLINCLKLEHIFWKDVSSAFRSKTGIRLSPGTLRQYFYRHIRPADGQQKRLPVQAYNSPVERSPALPEAIQAYDDTLVSADQGEQRHTPASNPVARTENKIQRFVKPEIKKPKLEISKFD